MNSNLDISVRHAAAIAAKNALFSRDNEKRILVVESWNRLESIKDQIKTTSLEILCSEDSRVSFFAVQVIAAIAFLELPNGSWPELLPKLTSFLTNKDACNSSHVKKASLEVMGFLCEELSEKVILVYINQIMTAVMSGLDLKESDQVQDAAAKALLNSLKFINSNMNNEMERNYIMQMVCLAAQSSNESISMSSIQALNGLVHDYYHLMHFYMVNGLSDMIIHIIANSQTSSIVMMAIEFWATVAELEADLIKNSMNEDNQKFALFNLRNLLPSLLDKLPIAGDDDNDDNDEWNESKAAATCLALVAEATRNEIFSNDIVLNYIHGHISDSNWKMREAAAMAFGSIIDGPDESVLAPIAKKILPSLVYMLANDHSVSVKDTVSWAICLYCDMFYEFFERDELKFVLEALVGGLNQDHRIAINCSWALMGIYMNFKNQESGSQNDGNSVDILKLYFEAVIDNLLQFAKRTSLQSDSQFPIYQSISNIISSSSIEKEEFIKDIFLKNLSLLEASLHSNTIVNFDDKIKRSDLHSCYCLVLKSCLKKLGKSFFDNMDQRIMESILVLFNEGLSGKSTANELEDVFNLLGSIVEVADENENFSKYIPNIMPFILAAAANHEENSLCLAAIGVIDDIINTLGSTASQFSDNIVSVLLHGLTSTQISRTTKPVIIGVLCDLVMVLGEDFKLYLAPVMNILHQAVNLTKDCLKYEDPDIIDELYIAILEFYTSIVQNLREPLEPLIDQIFEVILVISQFSKCNEPIARAASGLLGDLSSTYNYHLKSRLNRPYIHDLFDKFLDSSNYSEETIAVCKWAKLMVEKVNIY